MANVLILYFFSFDISTPLVPVVFKYNKLYRDRSTIVSLMSTLFCFRFRATSVITFSRRGAQVLAMTKLLHLDKFCILIQFRPFDF